MPRELGQPWVSQAARTIHLVYLAILCLQSQPTSRSKISFRPHVNFVSDGVDRDCVDGGVTSKRGGRSRDGIDTR